MTKQQVLITGAGGGLGSAMTTLLAGEGYQVFATDIDEKALEAFERKDNIIPLLMDVRSPESQERAFRQISQYTDGLDGLVNNAGLSCFGALSEGTQSAFYDMMDVNFRGAMQVSHTFFPLLYKRKGRVINISSETIKFIGPFFPYAISKGCLEVWTRAFRRELSLLGMKVILIRPGAHDTSLIRDQLDLPENSLFKKRQKKFNEQVERGTRHAKPPEAVAKVVLKALSSSRPKKVYHINNSFFLNLVKWLPEGTKDQLVKMVLGT